MNKILITIVVGLTLFLSGCTDAERASWGAIGDSASITCYSGGQVIFEDVSTGKVYQIDGDGITYKSARSEEYVRAYADCIVITK